MGHFNMQSESEMKTLNVNVQRTCDTFKTLNIFLKIFSLQSTKQQCPPKFVFWSICRTVLTATILATLSISNLYSKILYFYAEINISIKLTDAAQMIYDLCQYIVDLCFLYVYGRDISFEYFQQYGRIDEILEMFYYQEIKSRLNKLIVFFASMWIMSNICDFTAWSFVFGFVAPFVYALAYIYLLIKMLTTLDLTSQVMQIECRLRCICDFLCGTYMSDKPKTFDEDFLYKDSWFKAKNKITDASSKALKEGAFDAADDAKLLSKYYLLLIEQTGFINKMFGIRILLNSLSLLIDMVRFSNLAVRLIIGSQEVGGPLKYFPVVSSVIRLFTCVAVVICLVDHCEKAYRQRERILHLIDHYFIISDPSNSVRASMGQFRDLVESRPVTFHMAYFFRFDYSLLVSIATVVVTYTIIILQSVN